MKRKRSLWQILLPIDAILAVYILIGFIPEKTTRRMGEKCGAFVGKQLRKWL